MNEYHTKIRSMTVIEFMKTVKRIISFNGNSDHIKYKKFYKKLICEDGSMRQDEPIVRDIILITTVGWKEFLVGLAFRLLGERVFHVIHDWEPHPGNKAVAIKTYNFFASICFQLIFHSRSQAEAFGGRCCIFPLPLVRCISSQRNMTGPLLAFGRNEKYKNFDFVVKAAQLYPSLNFIIASRDYPDPGIDNLKIYPEFLTAEALEQLITSSQALILPYSSATQSGVIIEAYELSRPVIISNIQGLIEYVDNDTGAIIELNAYDELKNAMGKIKKLSERRIFNAVKSWNEGKVL